MKNKNVIFIVLIFLCISLLSISVGFSAMSTTLSINGQASFKPVDMIRVISLTKDEFYNSIENKSSYKPDGVSTNFSINELDGYATYKVKITNLGQVDKVLSEVVKEEYSNDDILYSLEDFNIGDLLKAHETKEFIIKFRYKAGISIDNNTLNAKLKFLFDDYANTTYIRDYDYYSEGECIFNGQGSNVVGECNKGQDIDFINTGIELFDDENYQKNFIMTFTITDVDDSRFQSGKRDTFMSALYEANDNIGGRYPGVLFRIEDKKFNIHVSNGQPTGVYSYDYKFSKEEFLNKEFKLIRYNDGESIKIYYSLDGNGPYFLMDITNLYKTFKTPLSFGANIKPDNTNERFVLGTMKDITFKFTTKEETLKEFNKTISNDEDIIFEVPETCNFNGVNANITGCEKYSDINYINSGVYLFNEENYKKDFDVQFTLTNYVTSNQESAQVTIMNAFLERTGKGYGMLLRRASNNLEMITRDGNGKEYKENFNVTDSMKFRIVKKNNNVCYSLNDAPLKYTISMEKFASPFNVPLTFGSSIDSKGNPWRYIKGDISNMYIKVGNIDPDIICG